MGRRNQPRREPPGRYRYVVRKRPNGTRSVATHGIYDTQDGDKLKQRGSEEMMLDIAARWNRRDPWKGSAPPTLKEEAP